MGIDLKKTRKPVKYNEAIDYLEKRVNNLNNGQGNELIWILEHPQIYTGGASYKKKEILDKSIRVIETSKRRQSNLSWTGSINLLLCY